MYCSQSSHFLSAQKGSRKRTCNQHTIISNGSNIPKKNMKFLLLLLTACVFVSVASSAPGPAYLEQFKTVASSAPGLVDLQQFITRQNRLGAVSDEGSFDTTSSNQDMVTLKQFKNHRGLSDRVSAQERTFQDSTVERNDIMATQEKRYGKNSAQSTADDSAALFEALRLAAVQTSLPSGQTWEQFWRAVVNNIKARQE